MPVNEIAITTIVVLAIRDCAGWLWRRSSSPDFAAASRRLTTSSRRRGASARKAAGDESPRLRSSSHPPAG